MFRSPHNDFTSPLYQLDNAGLDCHVDTFYRSCKYFFLWKEYHSLNSFDLELRQIVLLCLK